MNIVGMTSRSRDFIPECRWHVMLILIIYIPFSGSPLHKMPDKKWAHDNGGKHTRRGAETG